MKNYKEFDKTMIGSSDSARLRFVTNKESFFVKFQEDNSYSAYVVDGETEIPAHYKLVKSCDYKGWLKIYDDNQMSYTNVFNKLNVYRAGQMGIIIQVI